MIIISFFLLQCYVKNGFIFSNFYYRIIPSLHYVIFILFLPHFYVL